MPSVFARVQSMLYVMGTGPKLKSYPTDWKVSYRTIGTLVRPAVYIQQHGDAYRDIDKFLSYGKTLLISYR